MPTAGRRRSSPPLSIWGYVLINGVVILFTAAVYLMAKTGFLAPDGGAFARPGLLSVLMFIPLAFIVASVFDAVYDRAAARRNAANPASEGSSGGPDE